MERWLGRKPSRRQIAILTAAIIEMGLLNSSHVIAAMTSKTKGSQWVPYEYGRVKEPPPNAVNAACWRDATTLPECEALPEYVLLAPVWKTECEIRAWLKREMCCAQQHHYPQCPAVPRSDWPTRIAVPDELPRPAKVQSAHRTSNRGLIGSPAGAQSPWVAREIEHWREKHETTELVVAVTDGEVVWDEARRDFDWTRTTALHSLAGAFANEPLWADFHEARKTNQAGSAIRESAVRVTAGLRGMSPRDLDGEDLRQHRRTLRVAGAAIATLLS